MILGNIPKNKKIIIIIIGFFLLILAGGWYLWPKNSQSQAFTVTASTASPVSTPTLQYPKATAYEVPILMYHYIRNSEGESQLGKNLSVSPENFENHLNWLKENNYESLRVADLADKDKKVLSRIIGEKHKPIILTFDDGYADAFAEAQPILEKYQMTATFYIIRDYVGRSEYMSQEQIDKLEKLGFEIGSHTLSHPDLTKIDLQEAKEQIFDSKQNATTFCFPAGKYNSTTVSLLQEAGYSAAVTTHFGIADQDSSMLELPRVRVEEGSGEILGQKIEAAMEQSQ